MKREQTISEYLDASAQDLARRIADGGPLTEFETTFVLPALRLLVDRAARGERIEEPFDSFEVLDLTISEFRAKLARGDFNVH
jgi:hypothetical protein